MKLKHFIFSICIALFSSNLEGQTEVLRFKIDTKNTRSKKSTYSLVNENSGDLAFLVTDRKQIHAQLFNEEFNAVSSFSFDAPKRKYLEPLGYSISENTYNLLYANQRFSDFIVVSLDFDTKSTTTKELDFKLKDELYIETIVHNSQLLFLSSDGESIILRTLSKDNTLETLKSFDIKDITKNSWVYQGHTDFWGFFSDQIEQSNITKIDHRIPTAIEQASAPNKLYKFNNELILALEDEENGTLTYTIDLTTYNITENTYNYPKGKIDDYKRYNSFIYEDRIFQLASSRKEMSFQIKDLNDKLIKEFYVTKEDSITFKNGPIVQEGRTALPFQNRRELEASSKYLRKISSGDVGISVLKAGALYEITIGGYKLVPTNNMSFGVGFGGNAGGTFVGVGAGGFAPVFNPTFFNYSSYNSTKATYFDTVLTENLEHVKKDFQLTINDRIDDYMVDYKAITGEDLFFINDKPYYAYFNQKVKEFVLVEF